MKKHSMLASNTSSFHRCLHLMCVIFNNLYCLSLTMRYMSKNNENSRESFHICLIGTDLKKTTMKSLEYPTSPPDLLIAFIL